MGGNRYANFLVNLSQAPFEKYFLSYHMNHIVCGRGYDQCLASPDFVEKIEARPGRIFNSSWPGPVRGNVVQVLSRCIFLKDLLVMYIGRSVTYFIFLLFPSSKKPFYNNNRGEKLT